MASMVNSTSAAKQNALPLALGCAIGYFATRTVEWLYRDTQQEKRNLLNYLFPFFKSEILPSRSEVCIDLITIKKFEKGSLEETVSRVSLSEFLSKISYNDLNSLRENVGWLSRTKEVWDKVIPNSSYIVCVIDENNSQKKLIVNAFLLGNGRLATIQDVAVRPEDQRKRIGTRVMNQVIKHIQSPGQIYANISLFAANKETMGFYAKFGFKVRPEGMESWGKDLHESK